MRKAIIDKNVCKGCELCVKACPRGIIALSKTELNAKGYHPAQVVEPERCTACAACATMCPDCAITIER